MSKSSKSIATRIVALIIAAGTLGGVGAGVSAMLSAPPAPTHSIVNADTTPETQPWP